MAFNTVQFVPVLQNWDIDGTPCLPLVGTLRVVPEPVSSVVEDRRGPALPCGLSASDKLYKM